jgi:ribosomal protein S27E
MVLNLTNQRFGSLVVLRQGPPRYKSGNAFWIVRCDCGNETCVVGTSLTTGNTSTCGKGTCRYPRQSLAALFDRHTIPEPNSGCLLWIGSTDSNGYGQLRVGQKLRRATHVALELAGKPLAPGTRALHSCDNSYCVEENHLFHGTQKDNVDDMIRKGRHNHSGLELGRGWNKHHETT